MIEIAIKIIVGIVIAIVTSLVTIQLSLRKFRTEKWWERKVAAYEKVIEALYHSKSLADNLYDVEIGEKKLSNEREEELRARARLSQDEIDKAMNVGAFLLSNDAVIRLKKYLEEVRVALNQKSFFEYLDAKLAATNKCIEDFIVIAKKDLKALEM